MISAQTFAFTNLINRSIAIGTAVGGANTTHTFSFEFPVTVNIGSLMFEYCTDPIDSITCVNPSGSDVTGAVLDSQSGETGFSIVSTDQNHIILGRPAADVGPQTNSYQFSNVINPFNKGPFFVRISAYASSDGSGSWLSFSSVAASINQSININAEVPDILYFCAAVAIPTNCSDATGDFIDFGTLSTAATRFATSQFLVGTNAVNGYSVATDGPTMTSGTDQIPGLAAPDVRRVGKPQFGLNLRANLSPLVGAEPAGGSGFVNANYNQTNRYAYVDGDVVAQSLGRSEIGVYTVSYIVNINSTQPSGVYNTTITYVCLAGF
ncbi:MAG: hypothetical protein JWO96_725 [Candidatus Saccharibacteria bacterium]|nr:hypothetical protein [Candidatus Saccharibacteria bacterium]